ncbi:antirestriction protein [Halochromatium salexigens]|uniref:Antirestriction protein n=1 Tax=Halochromatium salexigens TaxID=49447 RepID=A0AAJ0UGZ3_HALSE|nr:antirestriction protein [Halochromatium salexigens]MBK5930665.1 hypothetical protein [Halochromatium salexigens]
MTITKTEVPESSRIKETARLFGYAFPLKIEPTIYHLADDLSQDYHGGYWQFWRLSNLGFYMAPTYPATFEVQAENGYQGTLSTDAFGITCCLYAYSHLSGLAEHYHALRAYVWEHAEAGGIVRAID